MLEVLQFIFSSFWIWLGTVIILTAIFPVVVVKTVFKDKIRKE